MNYSAPYGAKLTKISNLRNLFQSLYLYQEFENLRILN